MEKRPLSSQRYLILFAGTVLLLALLLMGFNLVTDPFGAFGDRFLTWWSYDETMNPRVAKLSYLEQHHQEYDSYIIGCSSTSSYPTEQLNQYFDSRFYNLIMYGADLYDVECISRYVVEHYEVKNLVLNLYIHNAEIYNTESDPLTYGLHYKTEGSSPLAYYGRYLLADPRYGLEKLKCLRNDSYVQQSYDVFQPQTGAYDKSRRDVEPIGDLTEYLSRDAYQVFQNYPSGSGSIPELEACMESVRAIKALCAGHGVQLTVVCPPMYWDYLNNFSPADIETFYRRLAQETDYWDFTTSSISFEPRYFYDETHFRNCVGKMALARMFGDSSVYVPEDFGHHVTADTVDALLESYRAAQPMAQADYTTRVPILIYHALAETGDGGGTISTERFAQQMEALHRSGYSTVTFQDLRDYVETGKALPDKPVVLTFDDGYASVLDLAYPILKEYGMCATSFVIGVSVGKDTYKDTGVAMTPHFTLEEATQCADVFTIQSHGYNIHEVTGRDLEPIRRGILQKENESETDYIAFLRQDCDKMTQLLGDAPGILAYPEGLYSELSEQILAECGIWATLTTEAHTNTLVKGIPQSLRQLGRYAIGDSITGEDLVAMLEQG